MSARRILRRARRRGYLAFTLRQQRRLSARTRRALEARWIREECDGAGKVVVIANEDSTEMCQGRPAWRYEMYVPISGASDDAWAGYENLLAWWWDHSWVDSLPTLREMVDDCKALPPVDEVRAFGVVCSVNDM